MRKLTLLDLWRSRRHGIRYVRVAGVPGDVDGLAVTAALMATPVFRRDVDYTRRNERYVEAERRAAEASGWGRPDEGR